MFPSFMSFYVFSEAELRILRSQELKCCLKKKSSVHVRIKGEIICFSLFIKDVSLRLCLVDPDVPQHCNSMSPSTVLHK